LVDRSRAPHHCPHKIAPRLAELPITARVAHPYWEARKLPTVLAKKHPRIERWSSTTTTGQRALHNPHGNGVYLDVDCGDCVTGSIFFGHRGQIAEINYTFDYIPDGVRRACQLTRVAKTFRWKEP
jgi:hypothetical protein